MGTTSTLSGCRNTAQTNHMPAPHRGQKMRRGPVGGKCASSVRTSSDLRHLWAVTAGAPGAAAWPYFSPPRRFAFASGGSNYLYCSELAGLAFGSSRD